MKWFLSFGLSWAITISVVSTYWGKYALLDYAHSQKKDNTEKLLFEMSARYDVMISAYKKLCFIRDTYDEEVEHLMGQIEIHQRDIQEKSQSRKALSKILKERNKKFGIGGN